MKSAISIIVTDALSGPLLGARTGWKLTVSADMAAGTENRDATANSNVRIRILFMLVPPFHLVVKVERTFKQLVLLYIRADFDIKR